MVSFLGIPGTGEGQTGRVANRIADELVERGHDATAVDVDAGTDGLSPDDYDVVLVGASIHAGERQSAIADFVGEHRDAMASKPTASVKVSLSSAIEEGRAQAAGYVDAIVEGRLGVVPPGDRGGERAG